MNLSIDSLLQSKWGLTIFSAIAGGVFTFIFTKIKNKIKVFTYTYDLNRVALSTEDTLFGKIEVVWEGNSVPNLYLATFNIENSSFTDFENIKMRIWCGPSIKLLQDNAKHVVGTFPIPYTEEYQRQIYVPPGTEPSDYQRNYFRNTRDFNVAVFNRGEKVSIQVLFLAQDSNPNVFLDIQKIGVKIKRQYPQAFFWGIPVLVLLPWTIISSFLIACLICSVVKNYWLIGVFSVLVGLFGQLWGALALKIYRKIMKAISF